MRQRVQLTHQQRLKPQTTMTPRMQQALSLLQLPGTELSAMIATEVYRNPLLEYDEIIPEEEKDLPDLNLEALEREAADLPADREMRAEEEVRADDNDLEILRGLDDDFRDYLSDTLSPSDRPQAGMTRAMEEALPADVSLFHHLMNQAHDTFETDEEIHLAELIIGNLDESGLLTTPLQEIAALAGCKVAKLESLLVDIQQFSPVGVGARTHREAALIQLRAEGKTKTLAYRIVDECFDEVILNNIGGIARHFQISKERAQKTIDTEIKKLTMRPGVWHDHAPVPYVIPDILFEEEGGGLTASINEIDLPLLHMNGKYLRLLNNTKTPQETRDYLKKQLTACKWLFASLEQRNKTLQMIAGVLLRRQYNFLENLDRELEPMTMKSVAEELGLHESTIARAVANKYFSSPRGTFSLRALFTRGYDTASGRVSAHTVKDLIREFIQGENKENPYTDAHLSELLHHRGLNCARRTVAKYRHQLGYGSARERRRYTT